GRADGAGAGAAGALLAPRLPATAADFATRLGGVCALAVVGVDGDDDLLHGLEAAVTFKGGQVGEILFAARLAVGTENGEFHVLVSGLFLRGGGFAGRCRRGGGGDDLR